MNGSPGISSHVDKDADLNMGTLSIWKEKQEGFVKHDFLYFKTWIV